MKTYLITSACYSISHNNHRNYTEESVRLFESAKPYNFETILYDNNKINSIYDFEKHPVLGGQFLGYASKPIAIYDTLVHIEQGDIVIWMDSNHVLIRYPEPIINCAIQNNIYCHDHLGTVYQNKQFTTKDMFIGMNCDKERYWNSIQIQANAMAFIKNNFTLNFAKEWTKYAIDYNIMIKNDLPNSIDFIATRLEQSIFSILIEKYKIPYRPYPSEIMTEMEFIGL